MMAPKNLLADLFPELLSVSTDCALDDDCRAQTCAKGNDRLREHFAEDVGTTLVEEIALDLEHFKLKVKKFHFYHT